MSFDGAYSILFAVNVICDTIILSRGRFNFVDMSNICNKILTFVVLFFVWLHGEAHSRARGTDDMQITFSQGIRIANVGVKKGAIAAATRAKAGSYKPVVLSSLDRGGHRMVFESGEVKSIPSLEPGAGMIQYIPYGEKNVLNATTAGETQAITTIGHFPANPIGAYSGIQSDARASATTHSVEIKFGAESTEVAGGFSGFDLLFALNGEQLVVTSTAMTSGKPIFKRNITVRKATEAEASGHYVSQPNATLTIIPAHEKTVQNILRLISERLFDLKKIQEGDTLFSDGETLPILQQFQRELGVALDPGAEELIPVNICRVVASVVEHFLKTVT